MASIEDLLEKIIEARLIAKSLRRAHDDRCRVETDPEGYAPCSCGAAESNRGLDRMIEALRTR